MQYHIRAFQTEQETSEYSLSSTTSVSHQEQLNICSTQTVALHVTSMLNVTRMPYEKCAVIIALPFTRANHSDAQVASWLPSVDMIKI